AEDDAALARARLRGRDRAGDGTLWGGDLGLVRQAPCAVWPGSPDRGAGAGVARPQGGAAAEAAAGGRLDRGTRPAGAAGPHLPGAVAPAPVAEPAAAVTGSDDKSRQAVLGAIRASLRRGPLSADARRHLEGLISRHEP